MDQKSLAETCICGISTDTRTLKPGELFVPLTGPTYDGYAFVADALSKGACGFVMGRDAFSRARSQNPNHIPIPPLGSQHFILVHPSSPYDALVDLAKAARRRMKGKVVAVTGSVGKTSVKEGLAHVLSSKGSCFFTKGNLNNHIGLPLTLANMPKDTQWGVLEAGMNHVGEIAYLMSIADPHISLVTHISPQHIANFSSFDHLIKAKSEIFTPQSLGIFMGDASYSQALLRHGQARGMLRWETFEREGANPTFSQGRGDSLYWQLIHVSDTRTTPPKEEVKREEAINNALLCLRGRGIYKNVSLEVPLHSYGLHWPVILAAISAVLLALGLDLHGCARALASFSPPSGRGNRLTIGTIDVIDSTYNAAPVAMHAALTSFDQELAQGGVGYIALGDMKELGEHEETLHQELIPLLTAHNAKGVWLFGAKMGALASAIAQGNPNMKVVCQAPEATKNPINTAQDPERLSGVVTWPTRQAMMDHLVESLEPGSTLLIKGARSMALEEIIEILRGKHAGAQA